MSFFTNLLVFLNGFRKLTICLLVVIVTSIFTVLGYITGDNLVTIFNVVVPSYFAGNVGEHITDGIKEFIQKKLEKK
jgi:hypothetical protein